MIVLLGSVTDGGGFPVTQYYFRIPLVVTYLGLLTSLRVPRFVGISV